MLEKFGIDPNYLDVNVSMMSKPLLKFEIQTLFGFGMPLSKYNKVWFQFTQKDKQDKPIAIKGPKEQMSWFSSQNYKTHLVWHQRHVVSKY